MIKSLSLPKFWAGQSSFPTTKLNRKAFFCYSKGFFLVLLNTHVCLASLFGVFLKSLKVCQVWNMVFSKVPASSVLGATRRRRCNALIFVGCFSLCLIFTVLQLRVCFFTKFAYVLRSCFSGLKGKQRYPWCSFQISIPPGLHWAPSKSRCHHWDQVWLCLAEFT